MQNFEEGKAMFHAINYIIIYIKTSPILKNIFLFIIIVSAASCAKVLADRASELWGPHEATHTEIAEQTVLAMQKRLPIKLDEVTTLFGIGLNQSKDTLIYSIRIENISKKDIYTSYDISSIKDQLSGNLCASNKKNFKNGYKKIEFIYFGNNDSEMFRILLTPEMCQKYNRQ